MSAVPDLRLAASFEQAGRHADAESAYRGYIAAEPQDPVARFNFACFLRRRGRLDEALDAHQAALDLRIERPEEVLSNMAVIQAELRRDAAAKLLLERALAANPAHIPALFNLALHHEEYGDLPRALALYRQVLALNPDLAQEIADAVQRAHQHAPAPHALVTQADLRRHVRHLLADSAPDLPIVSAYELMPNLRLSLSEPIGP
jgi:tetratricopeptide (TPR) repeat protein